MKEIPLIRKTSVGAVQYSRQAKIALFWPIHHEWSQDPPFIIYFSFLKLKKKIRTIHDTSIHVLSN